MVAQSYQGAPAGADNAPRADKIKVYYIHIKTSPFLGLPLVLVITVYRQTKDTNHNFQYGTQAAKKQVADSIPVPSDTMKTTEVKYHNIATAFVKTIALAIATE